MERTQAKALVTILLAAYPGVVVEPESVEVYVTELAALDDARTASEVVHATIRHSPRFPPISDLLWSYRQMRDRPTGEAIRQIEVMKRDIPPPEAVDAIRELGRKWKSPALVEFADSLDVT